MRLGNPWQPERHKQPEGNMTPPLNADEVSLALETSNDGVVKGSRVEREERKRRRSREPVTKRPAPGIHS